MSRHAVSLTPAYFDARYAADPDPWEFETSGYERSKYDATLNALPRPTFARAFEVGCSIGVLTARLAPRCDALLAVDVAEAALVQARARCRDLPNVLIEPMQVPARWPDGTFDLILLSEVVYYLDRPDVDRLAARLRGSLVRDGALLLVHWTGETDYPLSGDEASELLIGVCEDFAAPTLQFRTEQYRLDLLLGRHRAGA